MALALEMPTDVVGVGRGRGRGRGGVAAAASAKLYPGDTVVVAEDFKSHYSEDLRTGQRGEVKSVTADGDAWVTFDSPVGRTKIESIDFAKLHVSERGGGAAAASATTSFAVGDRVRVRETDLDNEYGKWYGGTVTAFQDGKPKVQVHGESTAYTWKHVEKDGTTTCEG
eukprot:gene255-7242_t